MLTNIAFSMEFVKGFISSSVFYRTLVSNSSEFNAEIRKFSQNAICKICPQYYGDYNNLVVELQKMLKQKTFKEEKDKYNKLVEKAKDMQDKMRNLFPELARFDKKSKWSNAAYWILLLVVTALAGIIGAKLF
jgi:hypothetical protein